MNIINDFEYRGIIHQTNDLDGIRELFEKESVKFYIGFDPTADSLHVGSLFPLLIMKRLFDAGHQPIALVGGATGLIGDPSFKDTERQLNTEETVGNWTNSLKEQISKIVKRKDGTGELIAVNNYDWTSKMTIFDFLRDVGKHFTINYMTAKESVKRRIETGISYTEFSYSLLQALDFNWLYNNMDCKVQLGGSDQWGNMTSGLELIRRTHEGDTNSYILTFPLIVTSDGKKFGKSEGNAIWLDSEKTSIYDFYQFWLNTPDEEVIKLLKYFTFLTKEEIESFEDKVKTEPHLREAQKALAEETTKFVHGEEGLGRAIRISQALFGGSIKELSASEIEEGFREVQSYELNGNMNLVDLLVESGAASSKRQAREFIQSNSIRINGEINSDLEYEVSKTDAIESKFIVLKRGKKNYYLVKYV